MYNRKQKSSHTIMYIKFIQSSNGDIFKVKSPMSSLLEAFLVAFWKPRTLVNVCPLYAYYLNVFKYLFGLYQFVCFYLDTILYSPPSQTERDIFKYISHSRR